MGNRIPDGSAHYRGPAATSDVARSGGHAAADTFTLILRGDAPSGPVAVSGHRTSRIRFSTAVGVLAALGAVSVVVHDALNGEGSESGSPSGSTTEPRTLNELDAEYEREQHENNPGAQLNVLDALDADFECSEPGGDGMVRDTNGCIVLPDRARAICPDTVSDEARGEALKAMKTGGDDGSDVFPLAPAPEQDGVGPAEIRRRDIKQPPDVEPGRLSDISHPLRLS